MAYKGIAYACFAHGSYTDGSAPVYSGGKIFSKLCSADVSFTRSNASLYADNGLHLVENGITGGSVSITVSSLDDDAQVDVLGLTKSEDGVVEETGDDAPMGGFGYVVSEEDDDGADKFVGFLIYKCQFGIESENVSTRGETTEFQTPQLSGSFMGVRNDASMKQKFRAHKTCNTEAEALAWVKAQLSIT